MAFEFGPARIIISGLNVAISKAQKELNSSGSEKLEKLLSQQFGSEVALPADAANAPLTSSISQLDKQSLHVQN